MRTTACIPSVEKLARPTVEHQATTERTDISIHHCRDKHKIWKKKTNSISLSVFELNQVVLGKEASFAAILCTLHKMWDRNAGADSLRELGQTGQGRISQCKCKSWVGSCKLQQPCQYLIYWRKNICLVKSPLQRGGGGTLVWVIDLFALKKNQYILFNNNNLNE